MQDFDALYAAHFHSLATQLYAYFGDRQEAQDVVQEAFCRALARWRTICAYDDPVAWVRRVAWNLATSNVRRSRVAAAFRRRHGAAPDAPEPSPDRVAGGHGTLSVSCDQRQRLTPVSMVIPGILRLRLSPHQAATGNSGFAAELARSFVTQARALIDWDAPGTVSEGSAELTSVLHHEESTGFVAGHYRLSVACVGNGRITATLALDAKQESTAMDCTTSGATTSVNVTAEQPGHTMSVTIAPDDAPIRAGAAFTITRR